MYKIKTTPLSFNRTCFAQHYHKRMDNKPTTLSSLHTHFVDIHEALPEEDEERIIKMEDEVDKQLNRVNKVREMKRPQRSINRRVSLETGFSMLNRENKAKDERKNLTRSGTSLGSGFDSANRIGLEVRKETSVSLRQNPLSLGRILCCQKRRELESQRSNGSVGNDESVNASVPAGRYFCCSELDEVKDFEDILLPKDEKWPFLLRFPIGCFGICLGIRSQAVLWRALATSPATTFLHVTPAINFALWLLAVAVLITVSFTYVLKCIFYFEAVKREYFHPVRVNFFFAPWVVCMFLAIGLPPKLSPETLHPAIWCTFMAPYFLLELNIYGQWLSGGKRHLCKVANPSSHLSVVGNFVGVMLASKVGWKEPAKFLWAVGFAHYLVVFVTLYQRLPASKALPKELHPVYSMFIAAPSAASLAWENIYGEFDGLSRN